MSDDIATGAAERVYLMELAGTGPPVTLHKLISKGERLEIATGDEAIKLDALLLESIAWQRTGDRLSELVDTPEAVLTDPVSAYEIDADHDGTVTRIASEYSGVGVSKVETENGPGVCFVAPERGVGTVLGPQTLREVVKIDDTFDFSKWFRTPFGPEDTPTEGAI
ncbi:hypothetical protein [Salinirussus salinus]|jgi:hypothetical protein|uniref:hypothetical protein n=1 Tax=Salinirussus salinus TaxID=1198300 RepID=UPI001356CD2D|nr:hypothetical protein [Salinirussus salinus]